VKPGTPSTFVHLKIDNPSPEQRGAYTEASDAHDQAHQRWEPLNAEE